MSVCKYIKPIDPSGKNNCLNCKKWTGKRCGDEAKLLAEEQMRYGPIDKLMRENRGVRVEE